MRTKSALFLVAGAAVALAACDSKDAADTRPDTPSGDGSAAIAHENRAPGSAAKRLIEESTAQQQPQWRDDALRAAPTDEVRGRADGGDAMAQYEMGLRYAEGEGVAKNAVEAVRWFDRAAQQGYGAAEFEMGSALLTGEGRAPDAAAALYWYDAAGPKMEEAAALADYLRDARQGAEETNVVDRAMWRLADGDAAGARELLAIAPETPRGAYIEALALYKIAEAQGFDAATLAERTDALRRSAQGNFPWAQVELSELLIYDGMDAVLDDPERAAGYAAEAADLMRRAAAQGVDTGDLEADLTTLQILVAGLPASDEAMTKLDNAFETTPGDNLAPDGRSELQICGRIWGSWNWRSGSIPGVLTFGDDNRVGAAADASSPQILFGTWTCDFKTSTFVITWSNNVVETLVMADDGSSISGRNNLGMEIYGTPTR